MVQAVSWEDREGNGGGFSPSENLDKSILLGKRDAIYESKEEGLVDLSMAKRFKLSEYDENQQEENRLRNLSIAMVTSPLPLGLSLRKTPSFAELIQAKLCQERISIPPTTKTASESRCSRPKKETVKLKASSCNGKLLRIGSWERRAVRNHDLVAKCYYQKRKLVWEMLDGKLKKKMEIQWSDITAIRAAFPENSNAVLEIEVNTAPLFFRETPPQPRKQSSWLTSSDFTGVQATRCRVHHLQFEEGILRPYYEKLLQCDERLLMLSQHPFPLNRNPYVHQNMPGYQNYSSEFNRHQHQPIRIAPKMQLSQFDIKQPRWFQSHQEQMYQQTVHPPNPAYSVSSPLSVMEFPRTEDHGGHYIVDPQRTLIRGGTGKWENHYVENQYQQPISDQCAPSSGNGLPRPPSTNSLLKDIANQLLNVPISSSCPDEQKLMARVNSMCNLLELSQEEAPTVNVEYSHSTNNDEQKLSQEHAPIINVGTSESEYSHSTNHSTLLMSPVELNESEGSMTQESGNSLPNIGMNGNPLTVQERNASFSDLLQALNDFGAEESVLV